MTSPALDAPLRRIGPALVSPIGLGGARWSLVDKPDEDAATRTVHAALECGVTLFDTALAYTTPTHPAHNEQLLAAALRSHPLGASAIVATKGGHTRDGTAFPIDARPTTLRRHCQDSLRRLGTEQIDLYQLHWPDPNVPFEDSVGALAELRDEGLVAMIGICNVDLAQVQQAQRVTRIDSVQNRFSPLRAEDRGVLGHCTATEVAYLAYSPLGGPAGANDLANQLPVFAELAAERAVTVHEIAMAWLLAQSSALIPIVGAGRPASVEAAARGATLDLTPAEAARLNEKGPR